MLEDSRVAKLENVLVTWWATVGDVAGWFAGLVCISGLSVIFLVADCMQNCTIKPPSAVMLKNRLRRLCATCQTAPLVDHLSPEKWTLNSESDHPPAFTYSAFARTPCDCENAVWLCQTCGHSLRNRDTTYRRIWTWRTHYSTYLGGGLGTGIGEGCQGVKCGKGMDCLAAQVIEVEVDAETDESMMATLDPHNHGLATIRIVTENSLLGAYLKAGWTISSTAIRRGIFSRK
jgi:hypothetical protein